MVITDLVYDDIRTHLASHAPERGGALYGPRGYPFVTHFEFDADGKTSAVSYVPSSRLIANAPKIETQTGLEFKGIIHSHPHGHIRPSGGDEQTVASFFRLNPHFSAMALPIVQQVTSPRATEAAPFLHWYRAERRAEPPPRALGMLRSPFMAADSSEPVAVLPEPFHVLEIGAHMRAIVDHLAARGVTLTVMPRLQHLKIQNAELVGLIASSPLDQELMYFVSLAYPITAPVVLYQRLGNTHNLRVAWDGMGDVAASLRELVDNLLEKWGPPAAPPNRAVEHDQTTLKPN